MATKLVTRTEQGRVRAGRGYWQNKWWNARAFTSNEGVHHPVGNITGHGRWPTAEIAEQKAMEWLLLPAHQAGVRAGTRWLGAVFVPEDKRGGA